MRRHKIALVSEVSSKSIPAERLKRVAKALQRQVHEHLAPAWGVDAAIKIFPNIKEVPKGFWAVMIKQNIGMPDADGDHEGQDGNVYAVVEYGRSWTVTTSHEILEMLADPTTLRTIKSPWPAEAHGKNHQEQVEIAVEICDPCQEFTYSIDGISVSDFVIPDFYTAPEGAQGRFTHNKRIKAPRQLARGGGLEWYVRSSKWWYAMSKDSQGKIEIVRTRKPS